MAPPIPTKLSLRIVTPLQHYEFDVDEVVLPGLEGELGVLPGHIPMFAGLKTGTLWYRQGHERHYLAVSMGFAEVLPDEVTVLAQVAERAEELDVARAEEGMRRAQEMMPGAVLEMDFERARLALLRTLQQLQSEGRNV
jgi:F-type H+-transporting ATPase subunit epsilon